MIFTPFSFTIDDNDVVHQQNASIIVIVIIVTATIDRPNAKHAKKAGRWHEPYKTKYTASDYLFSPHIQFEYSCTRQLRDMIYWCKRGPPNIIVSVHLNQILVRLSQFMYAFRRSELHLTLNFGRLSLRIIIQLCR